MAWKTSAKIKAPKRHAARPVGRLQAVRHRRDEAQPLQGDASRRSGRTATTSRTRGGSCARACATAARSASPASTTGRSTACTCARPASTCCEVNTMGALDHDGAGRRRRRCARCAARSCASSAGCRTRWCGARGEPGFTRVIVGRGARPGRRSHPRRRRPTGSAFYLTARGITNEVVLRRAEGRPGSSAPTTSTTRPGSATRRRPPR